MNAKMDRLLAAVMADRPSVAVPAGFTGRVMAHVRERAEQNLTGWFVRRVAMPLMAGGGVAALGFGLALVWLWQAGAMAELSLFVTGNPMAGF